MSSSSPDSAPVAETAVRIDAEGVPLHGDLRLPPAARGLVLFAHGSGSSRHSPRNRHVAAVLNAAGLATLLADLLTSTEEEFDRTTAHLRFDIGLLSQRLAGVTDWATRQNEIGHLPFGYFGASTGAASALVAAARLPDRIHAVVSRGGRPDLAADALPQVRAPTLLIVGGKDSQVIELNKEAMARMRCIVELVIVPGATHLFEEPGTLDQVAELARDWLLRYLAESTPSLTGRSE